MTGQTISHYRILDKLGEGGMGVVYKAEDLDLHRPVALKFLRADTLGDEHLHGRFWKEAEAAAALDHPNIPTVHEISEVDGQTFIAMAFIEGESLAEKIKQRPLPLDEALGIAIQVGEALQVAHERGIVHRDIKPANVMITPDGRVKVMDFGLAHLTGQTRITKTGTVMGTPAYMSPEQAEGQELDRRSDIWSLGVVLYEMVTGQLPFKGDTDHAVLRAILDDQPEPMTAIRVGTPPELDRIVGKALEKDAGRRYQNAEDVIVDLRSLDKRRESEGSRVSNSERKHGVLRPTARWTLPVVGALAVLMTVALVAVSFLHLTEAEPERPLRKWSFAPDALMNGLRNAAISPNGKHIAYRAEPSEPSIWVRDFDREEPRRLPGTEGATHGFFWSPDSRWIGFAADGQLLKTSPGGGPTIPLCQLPGVVSAGSWSRDGKTIAFGANFRIYQVPAGGGEVKLLFEQEETAKGGLNFYPYHLPIRAGAPHLVFMAGEAGDYDIVLKNLGTGDSQALIAGQMPAFSPSGHIVFGTRGDRGDGLWALPFSLDTREVAGEAIPIVENGKAPSISEDGTLVYVEVADTLERLVWRDREGRERGEIGQPQLFIGYPVISPDGRRVAVEAREGGNRDVWVHDIDRPIKQRLTFDEAQDTRPQWSSTENEITFQSDRGGRFALFMRAADGTGEAELLGGSEFEARPYGWMHDGTHLVYTVLAGSGLDIWHLKRQEDDEGFDPVAFLETQFDETAPHLSPDGRFIAYCSNQSGEYQVYVRPFPSGDGQWQVSTNGGLQPRWSRDGSELFYVDEETLVAVEVRTSPSFAPGSTVKLFSDPHLAVSNANQVSYDVSDDGRFVLVDTAQTEEAKPPTIHVVENWYEEFRDREQR